MDIRTTTPTPTDRLQPADIVDAAYQAILGHSPEPADLERGASALAEGGSLAALLADLVQSDAHWQRLLASRATEVAGQLSVGLLGRKARKPLLERCAAGLTRPDGLALVARTLSDTDTHWALQVAHRSRALVSSAHRSLLGQEPDKQQLLDDSEALARNGDIDTLLAALAASDAHWEHRLRQRQPALLAAVQGALLGQDARQPEAAPPTPDQPGPAASAFAAAVADLANSEAFWRMQLGARREAVVDAVYRSLLGRPVDPNGLATYGPAVNSVRGLKFLLDDISTSQEHNQRQRTKIGATVTRWLANLEQVDRAFLHHLDRRATVDEVRECLKQDTALGPSIEQALRRAIDARPESKPAPASRPPRVLLFGAFGNGNLGDAYQAMAMRQLVVAATGWPATAIFATSCLGDDFAYPSAQKLGAACIFDPALVNAFDLLLIGGGGLLAHPHQPLLDSTWARAIDTPIVLFGVGATKVLIEQHRVLLEKASSVSGRDNASLAALQVVRADATLVRDPILSLGQTEAVEALDAPAGAGAALPHDQSAQSSTLWILKHPTSPSDEAFLQAFAAHLAAQPEAGHRLVAIEPHLDRALERWFPDRIEYVSRAARLMECLHHSRAVVTMRYHGAIFAAIAGRTSFGCVAGKIEALYGEIGLNGAFFTDPAALLQALADHSPSDASAATEMALVQGLAQETRRQLAAAIPKTAPRMAVSH